MFKHFSLFLLLSTVLLLQGCSILSPVKTPPSQTYTLTAQSTVTSTKRATNKSTLLVSLPTASPGLQSSKMVYIEKPHQLNQFSLNRWIATPAEMLAPLIAESIVNTGCFDVVVIPPFSGQSNLNLQTNITDFQQTFTEDNSRFNITLNTTLTDIKSGKIKQRRFKASVPASENNPYAGVVAANEATTLILNQINSFVCSRN